MRHLWILAALIGCSHPPPALAPAASHGLDEPSLIALRRAIHREPELAGHEEATARRIVGALQGLGFEVRTHVGGQGVVAILRGGRPGPVIAYRADMDAVDDDEQADVVFRSIHAGAGHICGHDIHMAVAVGLAQIFAAERAELPGTLELIFQPGEEALTGARAMIDAGALADPAPREIYAVHAAGLPVGMISIAPSVGLPGLDQFDLKLPPGTSAPEVAARIRALSTVERPHDAAGWQALLGELMASPSPLDHFLWVRAFPDPKLPQIHVAVRAARDDAYDGVRAQIAALAPPSTVVDHPEPPFPGMFSDAALSNAAAAPLASVIGADHVVRVAASFPFNGEDFALFLHRVPGAMFWLGVANPEHGMNGLPHSPDFQADERAIAIGARAMAAVIRARMAAPSA